MPDPAGDRTAPDPSRADRSTTTVLDNGRRKAYRPIPASARAEAFEEAIASYQRGDYFEAHELLEPAWMGTDDPLERNLYQGLIKLSAAYVHWTRGNPLGVRTNLLGARQRLSNVVAGGGDPHGLDLQPLLDAIDARLVEADRLVVAGVDQAGRDAGAETGLRRRPPLGGAAAGPRILPAPPLSRRRE